MATTITANGINFPDGSAGSPSIGGSDTNTGLFTGSDIVGFATGGNERLKIDASGNINIANDSGKLQLGASADFQFFHDGSHSWIRNSTGNLYINPKGAEVGIALFPDGAVELRYNDVKKFETNGSGCHVTGSLTADTVAVQDNEKFLAGNNDDLEIYHSGSNSFIKQVGTGDLFLQCDNGETIFLRPKANEDGIKIINDGAVELYFNNTKRFETHSNGCIFTGSLYALDNNKIELGNSNDLQIFHDGSGCNIRSTSSKLEIRSPDLILQNSAAEKYFRAISDGAVELYYNNTEVLATQTNGIKLHNGGASYLYFYDVNTSTIAMYTNSVNLRWFDDVNNDNIMQLSQNGDLNIDGSYSNSGVDYAEYFESTDGTAIAVGTTVVLEDGKVRAATSSETPIGVIRPKTSGTSVTGGVNQLNWQGKYLVNDYDGQIMESAVHCTWTDDNEVNQQCWKDRPPTGVTIPDDAVETTINRPKLNPLFDESKTYVPRSERDEWNCVGLLGQIPITKGQPTSSSWIKMKDKNSTVELWMVK